MLAITTLALSIGISISGSAVYAQSSSSTPSFVKPQQFQPLVDTAQSVTESSVKKDVSTEDISLTPQASRSLTATDDTYGGNTSPDQAITISSNTITEGYIAQQGESRWYKTSVSSNFKLTAYMAAGSTSTDYDLALYRLNSTNSTLEQVSLSTKGAGQYELLSYVATPGTYYISVTSYQGADTNNPFTLFTTQSDSYDQNEPDDNPWFAKDRGSVPFISQQNIDNALDEDWNKITLNAQSKVNLRLNNPSANGTYMLQVWNANLQSLGTLNQNADGQIVLPAGSYYLQVMAPSNFDLSTPYTLSVNYQNAAITRVAINEVVSDRGVQGFTDYGYGKKWRAGYNITVKGRAFDATGNPVANGLVTVGVKVQLNNKIITEVGTTDSMGYFAIPMNIGPAIGQYSFSAPASTHYFDIIQIAFGSGTNTVQSDISSLYHFAYSSR